MEKGISERLLLYKEVPSPIYHFEVEEILLGLSICYAQGQPHCILGLSPMLLSCPFPFRPQAFGVEREVRSLSKNLSPETSL